MTEVIVHTIVWKKRNWWKFFGTILGALMVLIGIFGPFYIGGEVLPENWSQTYQGPDYWWAGPVMIMLVLWFFGFCITGVLTIINAVTKK